MIADWSTPIISSWFFRSSCFSDFSIKLCPVSKVVCFELVSWTRNILQYSAWSDLYIRFYETRIVPLVWGASCMFVCLKHLKCPVSPVTGPVLYLACLLVLTSSPYQCNARNSGTGVHTWLVCTALIATLIAAISEDKLLLLANLPEPTGNSIAGLHKVPANAVVRDSDSRGRLGLGACDSNKAPITSNLGSSFCCKGLEWLIACKKELRCLGLRWKSRITNKNTFDSADCEGGFDGFCCCSV